MRYSLLPTSKMDRLWQKMLAFAFLFMTLGATTNAQVYIDEDFSSCTQPTGWTTNTNFPAMTNCDWNFGGTTMPTGLEPGSGCFALFDDDNCTLDDSSDVDLLSPIVNTAGATFLELSFEYAHQDFAGDGELTVEVFDGTTWQQVFFVTVDQVGSFTQDVTPFANANFQIRFNYFDDVAVSWGVGIDNVLLRNISCADPSGLSTTNIGTTTATGTWTSNATGSEFQLELGAAGFTPGTGILVSGVTDTFYNAMGLMASTSYDWYVREVCGLGDTSAWVGPSTFTTQCTPFTAPYAQDFDGAPAQIPFGGIACWDIIGPGAADLDLVSSTDHGASIPSAPNAAELNDGAWPGDTSMLVSPQFTDLPTGLNRIRMDVAFESTSPSQASIFVGVLSDPNDVRTFVIIDTLDASDVGGSTAFATVTVNLDNTGLIGSSQYLGFAHGPGFSEAYIDNFNYEAIPSCQAPVSLNTVNIGSTTATGIWSPLGPGSEFQLELGPAGFSQGSGVLVSGVTDTFYNASSLTPFTAYDWYVREICAPGDTSIWSGPASFTTTLSPLSNPSACGEGIALPDNNDPGFFNIPINVTTGVGTSLGTDVIVSDVNIILEHTWRSDVTLELISPNGVTVRLIDNRGGSLEDFGDTTGGCANVLNLNMDAATAIASVTGTPATGSYVPDGDFSNFNDGSDPNGVWTLAYQDAFGGDLGVLQYVEIILSAPPTCNPPLSLNTVNITATSATGVWSSDGGPATEFQVEFGPSGFAQGTGAIIPVSDTFVNATSLTPGTGYDWYVREICSAGDTGNWSGPASFVTLCATFTAPLVENFDNNSVWSGTTSTNPCWSVLGNEPGFNWRADANGTTSSGTGPADDVTGNGQYMYTESSTPAGTGDTTVLETPWIDVSGLTTAEVSFWYHMAGAAMGDLSFDWLDSTSGVWTNLFFQSGPVQAASSDPFIKFFDTLPSSATTVKLRWVGRFGTSFTSDMAIDQFEVREMPNCLDLSGVALVNATASSIEINWNTPNAGNDFLIEYGPFGFTQGTGTIVTATDTFVNVSGLMANTTYDFYVREVCAPGDSSAWTLPFSATTLCAPAFSTPFTETFDGPSWVVNGAVDQCWNRFETGTLPQWRPDNFGTGSSGTGPADDVTGGGKYIFTETSGANPADTAFLETPGFDVSGLAAPQVSFYYHMFGATMGDMLFQVWSSGSGVWTTVWAQSGQVQISDTDPFIKTSVVLPPTTDTLRFRWLAVNCVSFESDMAIDEFSIGEAPANELELAGIDVPTSGCALTNNETVSFLIINKGSASQSGFPVTFEVAGQTPVTETVSATINSGDTLNYTFTAGADLSALGAYQMTGFIALATDTINDNDTVMVNGFNSPLVSSFPYAEDFAAGTGNWFSYGNNNSWELGNPANTTIDTAASDTSSWITNRTGSYNASELSFVESPCFDLSGLVSPGVSLNIWRNTEGGFDGAALQYSTDGGLTWANVGAVGDPNNWYNDNSVNGLGSLGSLDGWAGDTDTSYINASNLIPAGGQANVKLRMAFGSDGSVQFDGIAFDNINIVETALVNDLSVASVDGLSSGCGLSSTTAISTTIINTGIAAQSGFDVSYVVNGGTPVTETVAATVNSGDTLVYTFSTTADFSTPQVYDIDVYQSLAGDGDNSNDTASTSVESFEVPVLTTNNVTICAPQNVILIGSTTIGDIYWSDTSGVVNIGDSLDLGLVTSSQSYTAEAITGSSDTLSTTFAGGNGQAGNMFDIVAMDNITLDSFDFHIGSTTVEQVAIYYRVGTYVGNETNAAAWTFLDSVTVTGAGVGLPTRVPIGGLSIPAGATYGMWVTLTTSTNIDYTTLGAITTYSNADLDIIVGAGVSFPLGSNFSPRGWNGRVYYSKPGCTSGPQQVDVNFGSAPNTSFTWTQSAALTLSFTETIAPAADSVMWDFGDGNSSNQSNPTHTYATAGSYTVDLTAYLDGCDTTVTQAVFTNAIDDVLSSKVSVYPNPTQGQVVIETADVTFNAIEVLDMLGNTVMKEEVTFDRQKVLEIGRLTSGNYLIRLISEDGVALKRVTLNK